MTELQHTSNRGARSKARPDINLSKLAAAVGADRSHIGRVFNRKSQPSVNLAAAIAAELHITVDELISQLKQ